ncbi:unnamed protein product [Nesidiocoris tenuis]|uniref:Ubiquitin-like protease family profile domain-containing protein n=1 Tax=Nesidiocoris tenuis TaxID=355587 RepID=A0A6H5HMS8_9HEMI|nr:unnamed protein product [Nesidiocoris tenuis]
MKILYSQIKEKLHVAKEKVIEEKNKDREDLPTIPPEVYVKTVQKQSKTKPKYNKEIIKTIDHELKTAQIIPRHHNTKEKIHLSNIRRPKKFSESVINAWDDTLDRSEVLTKKFGLNITREDLLTLRESNWLNDKIINFYVELIDQRSRQNHKHPTTFSFNTFLLRATFYCPCAFLFAPMIGGILCNEQRNPTRGWILRNLPAGVDKHFCCYHWRSSTNRHEYSQNPSNRSRDSWKITLRPNDCTISYSKTGRIRKI